MNELLIILLVVGLGVLCVILVLNNKSARIRDDLTSVTQQGLSNLRNEFNEQSTRLREELAITGKNNNETISNSINKMTVNQQTLLENIEKRIGLLATANENRLDKLRETLDGKITELQKSNDEKLEKMRQTVDEKLQETLEKRLGESFKLVSERLEAVHKGLGDMQNLAAGVGDLKKVLTNVKTRDTWGEFVLGDILEQILTPDQYQKNVKPIPSSNHSVEYAVRLPGQEDKPVWLPIDSKFPQEDYQRIVDATEAGDKAVIESATLSLISSIKKEAKTIAEKYVSPPHTTDFAILFLPTEGLFSEILRHAGLVNELQLQHRIVIAGPTTLAATLSSLRMGFRTLAIEKRSSEISKILSAVKTEFSKFGDVLDKVQKQLDTASKSLETTSVRTRQINRKLNHIEEIPETEVDQLLRDR